MQFYYRFSALALALLFMGTLQATTFYVRKDGRDTNDGRQNNKNRAFRTIQKGLNAMKGGDILRLANGTWTVGGSLVLKNKSGRSNRKTVIRANNRWGAKIRFSGQWGTFKIENSNHVNIWGLDVGTTGGNRGNHLGTGIESFNSNYVTFSNNFVHDCGCGGISFRSADYGYIQDNVTRDNAKNSEYNCSGISVYQPKQLNNNDGYHIVIRRNVSFENECRKDFTIGGFDQPTDGNGIILDNFENTQNGQPYPAFKGRSLVENNLVFNNGGAGIKVFECDNAVIRHNTAWHNSRVLRNYPGVPGDISVTYSPGIFKVYNNIAVTLNDGRNKSLEWINSNGSGYMDRQHNILVGNVSMPGDNSKWDRVSDWEIWRGEQDYAKFVNATNSIGTFRSNRDFDRYFRLKNGAPGHNSGKNSLRASNDLEGRSRPEGPKVERGCYEGPSNVSALAAPEQLLAEIGGRDVTGVGISPNPNQGDFTVGITAPNDTDGAWMKIISVTGQVVRNQPIQLLQGANQINVNLSRENVARGMYYVQFGGVEGLSNELHRFVVN